MPTWTLRPRSNGHRSQIERKNIEEKKYILKINVFYSVKLYTKCEVLRRVNIDVLRKIRMDSFMLSLQISRGCGRKKRV